MSRCADCGAPRPDPDYPSCQTCGASGRAMTGPDDESKPMTRTELAMLWDLLGSWIASHAPSGRGPRLGSHAADLRAHIDYELTRRFGG